MKDIKLFNPSSQGEYISVSLVNQYSSNDFVNYFRIFDLKNPVPNVGLVGVSNGDDFALCFQSSFSEDFSLSVYVDGVNVSQKNGIQSLSTIPEQERTNYHKHNMFIVKEHLSKPVFLERFSQQNNENRRFVFTTEKMHGVNEILLNDPSITSRIDIYLWMEESYKNMSFSPMEEDDTYEQPKVGAGESTYKSFSKSTGLKNPLFFGKVTIVYVNDKALKHLGNTKIPKNQNNDFNFSDPMDLIPYS